MQEWLTAEELARRLKVGPETVRTWAREKRIPAIRISPKVLRFDLEAVARSFGKASGDETGEGGAA